MPSESLDFQVNRDDWHQTRFVEGPAPADPAPGQVLFRIDRFAITANNISYALAGDMIGYWRFFPAPERWGRIPAMGYADVIASAHPDVREGTRCFGFYPMSRYLVIEPSRVTPENITDGVAHRADIAPVYNQYSPTTNDAMYSAAHEDETMLLRGLFMTSFLCDDFLADADHYGVSGGAPANVLITSASSKTSIALAFMVARRNGTRAVGLTSPRNLDFVKGTGFYDEVRTYDEVDSIDASGPAVVVDMAGNASLRRSIHEHFGDRLRFDCTVGATHWDATGDGSTLTAGDADLPGPAPEFFFAPGQIQKRSQDWGPDGLQRRIGEAWAAFRDSAGDWLEVRRGRGPAAVEAVYRDTLDAKTLPSQGHVLSLHDERADG